MAYLTASVTNDCHYWIIDWDAAESWDPAGEWFELEWLLGTHLGISSAELTSAYLDGRGAEAMWSERARLVHLVEALDTIPNAVVRGDAKLARRARQHLDELVT